MHPNDFAFQKAACRCYEDVKNGLSSLKHKCNKQNIEMKVKIMPRSRGKEKKLTHRPMHHSVTHGPRVTYSLPLGVSSS